MINDIISRLYDEVQEPVIQGNQNQPKPPYPFIAYNVTSPYIQGLGRPIKSISTINSESEDFDYDIEETHIDQAQMTVSFTAYSDNYSDAYDLALKARDYFSNIGEFGLRSDGIIVVEVLNMSNTDALIVDDYERRINFDVRFRFTHTSKKVYETIEEVNIIEEE
jgi:hypothetical protein